uniref:Serine racemase n=2 Tax=Parascaris univalens TaxID=6257 RepID=A0A915AD31_PARUN
MKPRIAGAMTSFRFDDILIAHNRIRPMVHKTPIMRSNFIDELFGKKVFFKCEHLQKTGSFKARGAANAIKMLIDEKKSEFSVITHSSGNHGQALAWAAKQYGVPCTVVVPNDAPACKLAAMRAYGATLVECDPSERESTALKLCSQAEYEFVDPYDDYRVMAGQGTVAMEFLEQVPHLDAMLIPVGGGGLVSGMAVAVAELDPKIKIFCVEPEGKRLEDSLKSGERLWDQNAGPVDTIADGIRVLRVGTKCFPEVVRCCEKTVLTVDKKEIVRAMELIYSHLKQVVEPTGAVTLAALLKYVDLLSSYQKIGLILCGGNVDLKYLPFSRQ